MFKVILVVIVGVMVLLSYTKYLENRGIFFPSKVMECAPDALGMIFEEAPCRTEDGLMLYGWFIPAPDAAYTVLFFTGNAGNISYRLDKLKLLHEAGLNVYIIDYRGYGRSAGKPSEAGLYKDAQAAYTYLIRSRALSPEQIILYGESLGAVAAVDLAVRHPVKALILEGAFSNAKDMARTLYPYLPSWFLSLRFDSLRKIKKMYAPVLLLHSRDDEIVPYVLAKKLYDAAPGPKHFVELKGGHNSAFLDSQTLYTASLRIFIESLQLPKK
ncbi:MAG: alpha/beta hydrolase [Candidatus Omnitrophota bacterium]